MGETIDIPTWGPWIQERGILRLPRYRRHISSKSHESLDDPRRVLGYSTPYRWQGSSDYNVHGFRKSVEDRPIMVIMFSLIRSKTRIATSVERQGITE